jgi:hypothetical protein
MKKIAFVAFMLVVCAAAGRAQESRQDISLSGTALIEPYISSSTNVQVAANAAFGALVSYRFMLTPSSALEANYGITYQNDIHYTISNTNNYMVNTRTQEMSFAYVRSFTYRKYNPFVLSRGSEADRTGKRLNPGTAFNTKRDELKLIPFLFAEAGSARGARPRSGTPHR